MTPRVVPEAGICVLETNALLTGDEHLSAWDERVEKACSNLSHTH